MARQRRAQDGEPTTGQTLPQDVEAEALILSYLFYDPEGMPTRLFDTLHLLPADMYREQHRVLLQAIHTLHTQGEAPYVQVVVEELRESGKLDDAGGQPAISTLCDLVTQLPSPQEGQADALAKRVRELAAQRTSLSLASAYAQAVYRGDWNAAATLRVRMDEIAAGVHGQTSHFRLLTDEEVEQLPRPDMLVSNVLVANTLAMIYGDTGTGKSFLAIDLALHIALGRAWNGHPVRQGPVVYIAAEGAAGMSKRVRAWKQYYGVSGPTGLYFIGEACQLLEASQVAELLCTLKSMETPPVCVIIDTLGRSMDGGDENANSDIHRVIASADAIKRATGATVLLAHHDGKDDAKGPRGGSALRHDMDTVIALKLDGDTTIAKCVKQKDLEPFRPFAFKLRRIGLDEHADLTSCVIEFVSASTSQLINLLESDRQALQCLVGQPEGVTAGDWERQAGLKHRTFYNAIDRLANAQLIVRMSDRYHLTPNGLRVARGQFDDEPASSDF